MPLPRFHCPQPLGSGQTVRLPPHAAHHAARVLRLKPEDGVVLFNGEGGEYEAHIQYVGKDGVTAKTGPWRDVERESPLDVTLAQAVSSGERMDFTLQKAVELGVRAIQPLASERSVVKLAGERADKRVAHWQGVVNAACEQSGRNRVPVVAPIQPFLHWLGTPRPGLNLLLSPQADAPLSALPRPEGPITLLIGPEGGFGRNEVEAALSVGFTPVRLGARILRTETAALATLAAMHALWGDF